MKKVYQSSETNTAPFSGVYEANGFIFISGQVHIDTSGQLIGNTIEEKLDAVILNVKKLLEEAGLSLNDVIRVYLYLTDLTQLSALNKSYVKYFKHPLPARTAIGVSALPLGASLEMDVIALKN